jgi:hypothetical protein
MVGDAGNLGAFCQAQSNDLACAHCVGQEKESRRAPTTGLAALIYFGMLYY